MNIKLNNGVEMPILGLGTFRSLDNEAYEAVKHALKVGYRHIDTASAYNNEVEVGRAIKDSGIKREEIFVTTKIQNKDQGYLSTKRAFKKSLEQLGLDYIDLYLIHWPTNDQTIADTYQAMEELYEEGLIRAIGVSNFNIHHLEHLFDTARIIPVVNQVECHIYLQNLKLQTFCMKQGIYLEAYAPFLSKHVSELLADDTMKSIAKKYNKSIPQIALRFLIDRNIIAIPKSVTPSRIEENHQVFDFTLTDEDFETILSLNRAKRYFPEPDNIFF